MSKEEALEYLLEIATKDKRHKHYKQEVELAEECRAIMGDTEAQREIIRSYSMREDEEQLRQRLRLTNSITRSVLGPALAYVEEIIRADGKKEVVEGSESVKTRIDNHFTNFYRGESLLQYCFEMAKYASKLDPNCWTVFQYKSETNQANFSTSITDIYPIEVLSKDVMDYYHNETGLLEYLAFTNERPVLNTKEDLEYLPQYYFYAIGYMIHAIETKPGYREVEDYSSYESYSNDKKTFLVRTFDNRTQEVPAIRWSAYLSDVHDNEIGAPIYQDAVPLLKSIIRDVSFFDVHKVLHLRAEKFQYVKRCDDQDEESGAMCEAGYYGGIREDRWRCKSCGGTGKIIPSSEQNVITLAWPDRQDEVFNLSSLTHYAERPINLIEFYRSEIDRLSMAVMLAVYSQQSVNAANLASVATATQASIEYDKVNNKLAPLAAIIEKGYELAWRIAFNYYNSQAEAVMFAFPQDFKLQSVDALMDQYKKAIEAQMPYKVLEAIRGDIVKKLYRNSPEIVRMSEALEMHRPMKSKSLQEAALILQQRDASDPERQLYEQWDNVTQEMELLDIPFYLLSYQEQRLRMYETAAQYANNVVYLSSEPTPGADVSAMLAQLQMQDQLQDDDQEENDTEDDNPAV